MADLILFFWDVKHGSASLITTPNGLNIIYDAGMGRFSSNNEEFSPTRFLKSMKSENFMFDLVIISHPDKDHIQDLVNLVISRDFRMWERPKKVDDEVHKDLKEASNQKDKRIYQQYISICNKYNNPVPWENEPYNPKNNGNVQIFPFFPEPDIITHRKNNHSIVLVIEYNGHKVLLSGDNEKPSWNWLIENNPKYQGVTFLDAIKNTEIFLASHHGRESGYSEELMNLIQNSLQLVLISDESKGETSIPEKYYKKAKGMQVLNKENKFEKRYVLTTRKDGRIKIIINQKKILVSHL